MKFFKHLGIIQIFILLYKKYLGEDDILCGNLYLSYVEFVGINTRCQIAPHVKMILRLEIFPYGLILKCHRKILFNRNGIYGYSTDHSSIVTEMVNLHDFNEIHPIFSPTPPAECHRFQFRQASVWHTCACIFCYLILSFTKRNIFLLVSELSVSLYFFFTETSVPFVLFICFIHF